MGTSSTMGAVLLAGGLWTSSGVALASTGVERVEQAIEGFVTDFNAKDVEALRARYAPDAVLKLPGAPAVGGRDAVAAAWAGGFDNGLDALVLDVTSFDEAGKERFLESGTYELTIQTPDGPIVQTGTYAVLWAVPRSPKKAPTIMFDTIDAN